MQEIDLRKGPFSSTLISGTGFAASGLKGVNKDAIVPRKDIKSFL
jgi:hypothetical protein